MPQVRFVKEVNPFVCFVSGINFHTSQFIYFYFISMSVLYTLNMFLVPMEEEDVGSPEQELQTVENLPEECRELSLDSA